MDMVVPSDQDEPRTWGVGLVKIFPLSEAAVNKHLKWGGHLQPKDKTEAELSKAISPEASQGLNRGA
jgi:hypothetical protein